MRDQFSVTLKSDGDDPSTNTKWRVHVSCRHIIWISLTVIVIVIPTMVFLALMNYTTTERFSNSNDSEPVCMDSCQINLAESIPSKIVYDNNAVLHSSTHDSWIKLITSAKYSIDIAAYDFDLQQKDIFCDNNEYREHENVFEALLEAGRVRDVRIRIVLNVASPYKEPQYLSENANAQVKRLNFTRLFGKGIMHTKLLLVDDNHFYIGSANMNCHSMKLHKELGLMVTNCSRLGNDISKIFDGYWELPEDDVAPTAWPESLATKINIDNPMRLTLDGNEYRTFVASSPTTLSAEGRTYDLEAILNCINKAEKFIDIATVKYFPLMMYKPNIKYWPIIDDALRRAAIERKVNVRLLINWWEKSEPSQKHFLNSLTDLTKSYKDVNIEAKFFSVPALERPFNFLNYTLYRPMNHARYIVTDSAAYIGTSNIAGQFFEAAGIGLILEDVGYENRKSIRQQLEDVFQRDWASRYAYSIDKTVSDVKILKNSLNEAENRTNYTR